MGSRRKQKTEKSMIQNLYWKQVFRSPKTKIGLMVVIIFALAAIFAPVLAPHDPLLVDVSIKLKNPSAAYPLGTDQLGRCILSRLLWGSRYSLSYSFTVLLITVCVGVPIGLFAGYVGGKIDSIIMRIIDVFMAMPVFICGTCHCRNRRSQRRSSDSVLIGRILGRICKACPSIDTSGKKIKII